MVAANLSGGCAYEYNGDGKSNGLFTYCLVNRLKQHTATSVLSDILLHGVRAMMRRRRRKEVTPVLEGESGRPFFGAAKVNSSSSFTSR
ncbi:hypothetical protein HD806DRAFT_506673 [Xylariaceae sp. AK1471]|nr:hypothetical protein HD806DRAFT_506673 [Xylariaceae sp. AK1471]